MDDEKEEEVHCGSIGVKALHNTATVQLYWDKYKPLQISNKKNETKKCLWWD